MIARADGGRPLLPSGYLAIRNGSTKPVALTKSERIAQGLFLPYLTVDGDAAGEGAARTGGFGSTDQAGEQR